MSTSEPGAFTERGDQAEGAAYHADGVYSGGRFAGAEPERYRHVGGADRDAEVPGDAADRNGAAPREIASGDIGSRDAASRDAASRDGKIPELQHASLQPNATVDGPHSDRG